MIEINKVKIEQNLLLGNIYIYELSLQKKRTYIGFMKYKKKINNLPERLWKHLNKTEDSAKYVKIYRPKIKNNILQCKITKTENNAFAYEMFLTLKKMNENGINMVRGGPFIWVRDYSYREQTVIRYFINEMSKGWDNFLIIYNIFKQLHEDDFYVYIRGVKPAHLFTRQQIGLFNYVINHIKEKKWNKTSHTRNKDTIYVNLIPMMNIIKSLTVQNKCTNGNITKNLNTILNSCSNMNENMINLTQQINVVNKKRNFNEIETEEAKQITETIEIGETITTIEDENILIKPPTKKQKFKS